MTHPHPDDIKDAPGPLAQRVGIRDVRFGPDVTVVEPVNLYECEIAEGCMIGPFVEIQKGVRVGARTRIQSHAFLCSGVVVGEDCFIGHGVMFINDDFRSGGPARGRPECLRETRIGDRVSIGTGVTLLPVRVADEVVIGAGSVVTRDLLRKGVYAGNPARWLRELS